MKKVLFFICLFIIIFSTPKALELPVDITAESAILINTTNDKIVYTKNADQREILASLTKIMTAYAVINNVENLNARITVTEQDIANLEGFTCVGLEAGMVVTFKDLLYGLMLVSGADAAQTLAYHTSGNPEKFVELMNQEAQNLDLKNTKFMDSYGGDDGNVSTAREIGLLLEATLKNPTFNTIFKSNSYTMSNGLVAYNSTRNFAIYHGLDDRLITGNKSGYTPEAGLLLASTTTINNIDYIIVVMKCKENEKLTTHVLDTYKIIDYIKNHKYENRIVLIKNKNLPTIKVKNSTTDIYIPMVKENVIEFLNEEEMSKINYEYNLTKEIDSNFTKGDNLGYIDIKVGDEIVDTYNVYLEDDIFHQNIASNIALTILFVLIGGIVFIIFINLLLSRN